VEISCYFAKLNGQDWPVSMVTAKTSLIFLSICLNFFVL